MIRFSLTFLISFFILAFPTNRGTLFDDLHENYLPFISKTYSYLFKQFHVAKKNSKEAISNLFTSAPTKSVTDKIQSKNSSVRKKSVEKIEEAISPEDQELLRKIINEAR